MQRCPMWHCGNKQVSYGKAPITRHDALPKFNQLIIRQGSKVHSHWRMRPRRAMFHCPAKVIDCRVYIYMHICVCVHVSSFFISYVYQFNVWYLTCVPSLLRSLYAHMMYSKQIHIYIYVLFLTISYKSLWSFAWNHCSNQNSPSQMNWEANQIHRIDGSSFTIALAHINHCHFALRLPARTAHSDVFSCSCGLGSINILAIQLRIGKEKKSIHKHSKMPGYARRIRFFNFPHSGTLDLMTQVQVVQKRTGNSPLSGPPYPAPCEGGPPPVTSKLYQLKLKGVVQWPGGIILLQHASTTLSNFQSNWNWQCGNSTPTRTFTDFSITKIAPQQPPKPQPQPPPLLQ